MIFIRFKFLSLLIFLIRRLVFSFNRKHLLIVLLILEFIVLRLIVNLIRILGLIENEIYFIMLFLVFSVCEGALGLSILVQIIRIYGRDYFQVFNLLKC